jgi:hypothetical protein
LFTIDDLLWLKSYEQSVAKAVLKGDARRFSVESGAPLWF